MTSNILTIEDPEEKIKKPIVPYDKQQFYKEFEKHLALILVEVRTPIKVHDNWDLLDQFGVLCDRTPNRPRRYKFFCKPVNYFPTGCVICGHTLSAKAVMAEVKKRLKDENWISYNVIELPLRKKIGEEYYNNTDNYMREVVSECLDAENRRLIDHVLELHRAFVTRNRK